jgi:hypothetical protein
MTHRILVIAALSAFAGSLSANTQKTIGPTGRDFTTFQAAVAWLESQPEPLNDDYEFIVDPAVYVGACTLAADNSGLRRVWFHAAVPDSPPELQGSPVGAPYGAFATATARTVFENIRFTNNTAQNPSWTVLVSSASACTLQSCSFAGGGAAIWLDLNNAPGTLIRDCMFTNSAVIYSAVYIEGNSAGTRLFRCAFLGAAGPGYGSIFASSPGATIDSCRIAPANNNPGVVAVGTCHDLIVRDCEILGAASCISLSTADRARIESCRLVPDSTGSGIRLNTSPDVAIRNSSVTGGATAITTYTGDCPRLKIDSVSIQSCARTAIDLGTPAPGCRIRGCAIEGDPSVNGGAAIRIPSASNDDSIVGCRITLRSGFSTYSTIRIGAAGSGDPARRAVLADNFIVGHASLAEGVVNLGNSDSALVAFNTIIAESDLCPAVIFAPGATSLKLVNNIVWNRASSSGAYRGYDIGAPSTLLRTDHNDIYAGSSGNPLVRFHGADYSSLAAWQSAAIRPDSYSISQDPLLVSPFLPYDLHLQDSSPCIAQAEPVPGILWDIDRDPRDTLAPDIGADEFVSSAVHEGTLHDGTRLASLSLAPNPVSGPVLVRFALPGPGPVRLSLYDVLGRPVREILRGRPGAGEHVLRLDSRLLVGGTYIVELKIGSVRLTRKLVVSG